ncbi:cobalamin biosynthesis protein CobD [Solidesulfovibrio fructosivorans JJ]]|uniref:Cobalamin biosynthesis protein CobD n=1 Tax=Solidesulfovibrio fructosivorans JJ] TaxID=596151 RepID=E1JV14_SOLFR|nr:adenosylcobinamide-phosphate synthase CbiB [Solidesulfovibrio fructosivorans]EFL51928.1 cobalamin biosynthesis protein CobD [Solidesulfovibrio fructosivorans JJ]]
MHIETWMIVLAVGLDLALADPLWLPHPVRAIGAAYAVLDALADRLGLRNRFFGACCVALVAGTSGGIVWLLGRIPGIGAVCGLYFAYAGLALGGLLREGRKGAALLENGQVEAARTVVAGLVSRDVTALDAAGLWRALAETVAENANDAFVAPFFWLAVAGLPGLWAYKAVSTADSMWGYRTPRYRDLGWFGARADDALAWLPARIAAVGMWIAAKILGMGKAVRFGDVVADARKSASPNAGWPMAAAAWLCGASMGGPSVYFGRLVQKPVFGPTESLWDARRFAMLMRLVLFESGIVVVVTVLL